MRAFRIADRRYPIFDGTGARLLGGRWNSPGSPVIYAAETYSGALLEVLIHANLGRIPKTQAVVTIEIPESVRAEVILADDVSAWDIADQRSTQAIGDKWIAEQRSAVLIVPSMVTRGREHNIVINPNHPDFGKIQAGKPELVRWDERLFKRQ